jgi:hypothetical protein
MAKAPVEKAQSQRERFIEAARAAGADEDEEAFGQRLKVIAGANSSTGAKKKPKPIKARKK